MESMLASGTLVAVMDFSLVEVSNHLLGSVVTAGSDRLEQAGKHGIPQIVAPAASHWSISKVGQHQNNGSTAGKFTRITA